VLKIGITGSYGKTSVKEILKTLLSVKYRVLATPESYNTPLGISLTVHKLDAAHDIFIAEMGAREMGDIGNLAKLVTPDIAILTGVNEQHLESFKSVENIKNTKYELFEKLKVGGKAFFDGNNAISRELSERFNGEKYLISENDGIVKATDVKISSDGTMFKLVFDNGSEVDCFTTLIGKHSVRNILLAVAVAYKIGLTPNEISLGISRLHAVKHRLEILPNNKGITLIDDSYNANSDGAMSALETMSLFPGRKIIVTPGLVELGSNQNEINYKLGKEIATKCDKMIISAKYNAEILISGFIDGGGDRANIMYANGVGAAKKLLSEVLTAGDVVLFENDLPDIYD
jgi:UDP-N-acetylmuramoyl-tripeptide--D-alanyl-D-alanine ligase